MDAILLAVERWYDFTEFGDWAMSDEWLSMYWVAR